MAQNTRTFQPAKSQARPPCSSGRPWRATTSPHPSYFQCQEQIENVALQQQLSHSVGDLHKMEVRLQAESFKTQQLEQMNSNAERMMRLAEEDLDRHKRSLGEVSAQLQIAKQNLTRSEQRSMEQWSAVISLARLLSSQVDGEGNAVDVASLFIDKEALRRDLKTFELDLASCQARMTTAEAELQTNQMNWEDEVAMWRSRSEDLTKRLQDSDALAQELETTKNQLQNALQLKDQEIGRLRRQYPGSQTQVLVGPAPPRKSERRV